MPNARIEEGHRVIAEGYGEGMVTQRAQFDTVCEIDGTFWTVTTLCTLLDN